MKTVWVGVIFCENCWAWLSQVDFFKFKKPYQESYKREEEPIPTGSIFILKYKYKKYQI